MRRMTVTSRLTTMASAIALTAFMGALAAPASADEAAAKKWIDEEFQPSTLTKDEQMKEMQWFIDAAKPFAGMEINVVSETITTHEYEIEGAGQGLHRDHRHQGHARPHPGRRRGREDADPDADGPEHLRRLGQRLRPDRHALALQADGQPDRLDGRRRQGRHQPDARPRRLHRQVVHHGARRQALPAARPAVREPLLVPLRLVHRRREQGDFKAKYGYDLGVPVNWSAYEDIAEFFTNAVKEIDGVKVYGHMDYGKKDPSLGWRFTDAWLSMAGNGDKGMPNGLPVDEWGIRMEGCRPVGSSVARGGDTNGPAAVYSIDKYLDWLNKYAPPEAQGMTFSEAGPVPAQGNIAQQIFWYTAFTADMVKPGLPVVNADGTPKWRMAPSPHGAYWKDGMKLGYQDVGS